MLHLSNGAKWGPSSFFPSAILEREEYRNVWQSILSRPAGQSPPRFMVRGTKGIGKSVFVYWLIYTIVTHANKAPASSTTESPLDPAPIKDSIEARLPQFPTFLLLLGKSDADKRYYLLHRDDCGRPVVTASLTSLPAHFLLSDVVDNSRATPRV